MGQLLSGLDVKVPVSFVLSPYYAFDPLYMRPLLSWLDIKKLVFLVHVIGVVHTFTLFTASKYGPHIGKRITLTSHSTLD